MPQRKCSTRDQPEFSIDRYIRNLYILLFASIFLRIIFLLTTDLSLTSDEAYYWDWSRHPALSYYSKGPLVAYLMGISTFLGGDSAFFVRLPAVLLGGLTLWTIFQFARDLFDSTRTAFWVSVLFACVPVFNAGSILLTIDNPLFCCWVLGLWMTWRAVVKGKPLAWILAGIAIGIGVAAKAVMVFYIPTLFFFLLGYKPHRKWIKYWGPWVAILIAFLFFLPQLYWNAQHDWVMFKDFERKGGAGEGFDLTNLLNPIELVITQAGILSPLIFVLIVITSVQTFRNWRKSANAVNTMLVAGYLPVVGFYLLLSFKTSINANWFIIGYATLMLSATQLWCGWLDKLKVGNEKKYVRMKKWGMVGLVTGLLMSIVLFITGPIYAVGIGLPAKLDPSNRLYGGQQLGEGLGEILDKLGAENGSQPFIAAARYQVTAWLAFYTPEQPETYCFTKWARSNQYYFINETDTVIGKDGLFIARGFDRGETNLREDEATIPENATPRPSQYWIWDDSGHWAPIHKDAERAYKTFESFEYLEEIKIHRGPVLVRSYHVYLGKNFREWKFKYPDEKS